jgi:hypothetical protein
MKTREEKIELAILESIDGGEPFGITVRDVINEISQANDDYVFAIMCDQPRELNHNIYLDKFNAELTRQLNEAIEADELETLLNAQ